MADYTNLKKELRAIGLSEEQIELYTRMWDSEISLLNETFDENFQSLLWKLESKLKNDQIQPSQEEMDQVLNTLIKKFIRFGSPVLMGLFKTDMIFILKQFKQPVLTRWNKEESREALAQFLLSRKV